MNKIMNSNYRELIKFEIARARKYFDRAEDGIRMLSPDARLPVSLSVCLSVSESESDGLPCVAVLVSQPEFV